MIFIQHGNKVDAQRPPSSTPFPPVLSLTVNGAVCIVDVRTVPPPLSTARFVEISHLLLFSRTHARPARAFGSGLRGSDSGRVALHVWRRPPQPQCPPSLFSPERLLARPRGHTGPHLLLLFPLRFASLPSHPSWRLNNDVQADG